MEDDGPDFGGVECEAGDSGEFSEEESSHVVGVGGGGFDGGEAALGGFPAGVGVPLG